LQAWLPEIQLCGAGAVHGKLQEESNRRFHNQDLL
jgi:hypothetical protein